MEENNVYGYAPQPEQKEMKLSAEDKALLSSTAKWAKFISIFTFVLIGFMIICFLIVMLAMGIAGLSSNDLYGGLYGSSMAAMPSGIFWAMMVFYLILYAAILLPTIHLYRFSRKAKNALASENEAVMTESLRNLHGYFKITGIVMIAALALGFLFGIMMGIVMAASSF